MSHVSLGSLMLGLLFMGLSFSGCTPAEEASGATASLTDYNKLFLQSGESSERQKSEKGPS